MTTEDERIKDIIIEGYRNILKRDPDPDGLREYTEHIKNGMTIEKFHHALTTSDEHIQNFGGDNRIKNIIIEGYRNILKRDPDPDGLREYTEHIKNGMTIEKFHHALTTSDEHIQNFGGDNRIKNIIIEGYRNILKRDPDPDGLREYTEHIKNGMTIEKFHHALIMSDEHIKKYEPGIDKNYLDNKGYIKINRTGKYKVNKKNILISIQTYNGLIYLKRIILSLKDQDCDHNLSLFVIDNCSTDGTLEWLKNMRINYELLEGRRCSAAGLNRCLEKLADNIYDYMLVLNNDILLEKNYIGTIVDDFEDINRVRYGCLLMNGVQTRHLEDKQIEIKQELQDIEDNVMTGDYCAFIVKKEVIDKVGYFDERFIPRYIEDNDFTHRIYLSGGYCIRNGKCKFDHVEGAIFGIIDNTEDRTEIMINNSMIYKDKWGSFQRGGERFFGLKQFIGKFPFDGGGSGKNSGIGSSSGIFDYKKGIETIIIMVLDKDNNIFSRVVKFYKNKGKRVILASAFDIIGKDVDDMIKISENLDMSIMMIKEKYPDSQILISSMNPIYQKEFDKGHMSISDFILTLCGIDIYHC